MQSYKGYIDNITYHNHENGFTIARLVADGEQKKITVVGAIAALHAQHSIMAKWKVEYLKAVLRRDIGWFDQNHGTAS